jgi:hypothetical protein
MRFVTLFTGKVVDLWSPDFLIDLSPNEIADLFNQVKQFDREINERKAA